MARCTQIPAMQLDGVRSRRWLLLCTVALIAMTVPATAGAGVRSARLNATLPAVDTIQVGPIRAGDGFSLLLTDQRCGSGNAFFQLAFRKLASSAVLSHTYTGAEASCSIKRAPAGATLRVRVPGVIDVGVRLGHVGRSLRHPGLPAGCGGPFSPELPATAAGRIRVTIHPALFGHIAVRRASAQIFASAPQQCPEVQAQTGSQLTAQIGPWLLNADQPSHGTAQLDVLDPTADALADGLQGTVELQIGGPKGFRDDATGTARLGGGTAFTDGSLGFAALPACQGYQAQNGTLSGTLTLRDSLLGRVEIDGANAGEAFIGVGAAQAGTCNGPGSQPVAPALTSSCDQQDAGCSVQAGANLVTFFEETDPGTQTIDSEELNFGDGSAPVAFSNYGSVQHAYTTAGTYTATLSVTDALNRTTTSTTAVVIDP